MKSTENLGKKWIISIKANVTLTLLFFVIGLFFIRQIPIKLLIIVDFLPVIIYSFFNSIGIKSAISTDRTFNNIYFYLGSISLAFYSIPFFVFDNLWKIDYHLFLLLGFLFLGYAILGLAIATGIYYYLKRRYIN